MYKLVLHMDLQKMYIGVVKATTEAKSGIWITLSEDSDRKGLEHIGRSLQCRKLCEGYYAAWLRLNQFADFVKRGRTYSAN